MERDYISILALYIQHGLSKQRVIIASEEYLELASLSSTTSYFLACI